MSTIPLYNALIKAGVDPDGAQAAADSVATRDAIADHRSELEELKRDSLKTQIKLSGVIALVSVHAAISVATLFLVLRLAAAN